MRVHIKTTPNKEMVPFTYQQNLVGTFHKWLGHNNVHNKISLYSLSWLQKSRPKKDGLNFPYGAHWFVSFYEEKLAKQFVKGILDSPNIAFGLVVEDVIVQEIPSFLSEQKFLAASPILIKEKTDNFLYFDSPKANEMLTNTLKCKLKNAGLSDQNVYVKFDTSYENAKTKGIVYHGIRSKGSICPIIVSGTKEQVAFAWCVGVGNSTGIGFGALI